MQLSLLESPQLLQLHNDFLKMLEEHNIEIISFGETKPTRVTALKVPLLFVNPNSAGMIISFNIQSDLLKVFDIIYLLIDPGVGEFFEIPQDHLSICKPANR